MKVRSLARFLAVAFTAISLTASPAIAADSWEVISTDENFVTKRKHVEGSSIFAFRGETVADVSIGRILSVFTDSERRKDWVDRFYSTNDLKKMGEFERTYYIRFGLPFPIEDRDYVLHAKSTIDEESRVVTAHIQSVEDETKPIDDCCVRAQAYGTFYRFEAIPGENKTKVEVEVHTNPKGMLPSWLVNLIQKNWPRKTLNGLIREARMESKDHQRFVAWHTPALPEGLVKEEADEQTATAETAPATPVEAAAPAKDPES
ncbi:MAG: START domain-containing protein [Myxococcota bacterium]|nr:START domain-containing protein [Myxococcota bacterium]